MYLHLNVDSCLFLNIALYLNDIPLIRQLTITNESETAYNDLVLHIATDQPCILPLQISVATIPARREVKIPVDALQINRSFINALTETEKVVITISVEKDGIVIASKNIMLPVHPLEYFSGFQSLPELIAAYITPNHPYVYHIKRKAIDILEKQRLPTIFDGYQSNNPERVLQAMSAIYSAIVGEEIIYSSLPPGYEEDGQRLRLLNTIQKEKFGNCIDISLLFAACLEAIDLNPILIIVRGHAFVGCWLHDDKFAEIVNDDKTAITKRLSKGIREIAAVEATTICKGSKTKFTDALDMGEAQLIEREHFLLSVDIKRARTARIRPLPLLTNTEEAKLDEQAIEKDKRLRVESKFELGTIYTDELLNSKQITTKQKLWERKLLDLSLRNNLLNLRMTRNMLQLVDIDISHLEDVLSDGASFTIVPDAKAEVLRRYNLFMQPQHASSPNYQIANDELKYNRLLTYYHQQDLDNILGYIQKNAKQAIEENGSSTLYLGIGLLKWYDLRTPGQPRFAPILLLPVELNRRSANSKFTLRSREEETMINITLLEFLRQEYQLNLSGLEQLPYDEKGVDVAKVMGTVRRAVMQQKGWDVEEQLVLGNFSFSKLILWKDIVEHEAELLKSDMVRSLIDGKLNWQSVDESLVGKDLDAIPAQSIALPIATDASQMEAVLTAQKGQSFILHGPPGTGKSQTITNIIADALNRGKRILFVAAKKAALDVVHKRLEQIGLSPFTLELHSNKSKKSDVLAQLATSLETVKLAQNKNFEQEAQRLDNAKKAISDYVNVLHRQLPVGWSLYQSITILEDYREHKVPAASIPASVVQRLDAALWQQWCDWLPSFISIASLIDAPKKNPLAALQIAQYSALVQDDINKQTVHLLQLLPQYQQAINTLAATLHFPYSLQTQQAANQFEQITNSLKALPDMPLTLAVYLSDKNNYSNYEDWSKLFLQYQNKLNLLLTDYSRSILSADVAAMERQWKEAEQTWFLPKWWNKRKIRKQVSSYKNTAIIGDEEIMRLFAAHREWQDTRTTLQQQRFAQVQKSLGNYYKEEQTNIADLDLKVTMLQRLNQLMGSFERNALGKWLQILQQQQLAYTDDIKQLAGEMLDKTTVITAQKNSAIISYQLLTGLQMPVGEDWVNNAVQQLSDIQAHLPKLKDWINYVHISKQGRNLELDWIIDAFEQEACSPHQLNDYFLYNSHRAIAQSVIAAHESLSLFSASLFESKIEQYKKIAKDFQILTIQQLRARLSSQLPNATTEAMQSSEIGILQRAIKSRGRGMSIRRLFDQIPTLLPRLSPCMLMSPISVAQYFDVDASHFDLVIFDEASQMPTCEAVSALARAQQAIIVGDPKQMPPTSFFTTNKIDEEDIEIEDLESILDDCLSLSIPSKYLLRHYRSKHESLIAFSNANYYDNKLLTFPSADDLNRKVKYHHVPGHYDKGKTRTNSYEADAIVRFIQQHYSQPSTNKLSLGVVTFSQTQQTLVEDKLQQLFIANPELEQAVTECAEPLFIKNLENVQGDERDVILFSIGYAPDESGKLTMNFGPLNRNGGWRRLNVAVTRARYAMHVFATLKPDQIDLNRTSAEGVAGLKSFLHFAESGHLVMRPQDAQAEQDNMHLCDAISKRLEDKGFQVKNHIGTSGFKIDIGVVHPNQPEQYILGIVLDGQYYYDARTANDRELVMPSVLKALGWAIHRVWTMDWFENADKIEADIIAKVETLKEQPIAVEELQIVETNVAHQFATVVAQMEEPSSLPKSKQKPYLAHALTQVPHAASDTIYYQQHRNRIKQQIQMLLNMEAPISKNLLYKKLLQAWNTSRVGARLDAYLNEIILEMNIHQTLHHQPFYWSAGNSNLEHYRSNETEKRAIEDIAPEEIIVALEEAVQQNLSIEEEDLIRYLSRTFSFAKVGKQIEAQLRYAIAFAVEQGVVKKDGSRIKVR